MACGDDEQLVRIPKISDWWLGLGAVPHIHSHRVYTKEDYHKSDIS
jgi:hypothetical protein